MFILRLKIRKFISDRKTARVIENINSQVKNDNLISAIFNFIFKFIVLFVFGIFIIFPFYFMFVYALAPEDQILDTRLPVFWPNQFTWDNFTKAAQSGYFKALGITASVSLIAVVGKVFFSMTFGYAFSLRKWRFKQLSWAIFLSILVLPETALIIGQYRIMVMLGWNDGFQSIFALTAPFIASVFSGLMFRQAFEEIPDRIKEASMVDGCSRIRYFFKVAIPMVSPTIWTVGILTALAAWNATSWPLVILQSNSANVQTLNIWLLQKVGVADETMQVPGGYFKNIRMAGALLAVLPMFIVYFVFRSRIMKAVSRQGSTVKG
ncbi:carbohydrate ABC transporter permease [Mesomycoplasma hyopneumoniae]|uniref:carbohydrate ABC transporter permease n=1 Tax=Mesomycoplasma hyopneumoniae TaxID=2099 RepID=UPI001F40661D|nr:carbohydrate ABC transporter permease [Mesomycoplasma hyopneumoniae]UIF66784.1 carbohydrate ABC transporter permease [Mesomycoplasma hyopneumoniae]